MHISLILHFSNNLIYTYLFNSDKEINILTILFVYHNRSYEAKVHFGSRSLIIELVNEPRAPMTKYLFKHFAEEPSLCKYS